MPQKVQQPQIKQMTIDLSGRAGLAFRHWGDLDRDSYPIGTASPQPELRYLAKDGQMVGGYYNPFRRLGYLSAANTGFTDVDQPTAFTAIPNCCVYDDVNGDLIVGSDGRYFQQLSDLDDLQFYKGTNYGDYGTTGTPTVKDLDIHEINGARRLYVVYEKSGLVEVGHYPLSYDSGAGIDTLFSSFGGGSLSFGRMAFMRVADNGFAYLFTDNTVHKIDGTAATGTANGTVTPNVLIFPATFTITDAVDFRGNIFMAIVQAQIDPATVTSESTVYTLPNGVYVWDRQSTQTGSVDYVPIFGIKVIHRLYISPEGKLRAMVTSGNGVMEIREYNGATFVTIEEVGRGASPQWHDSVRVVDGLTIWLGRSGDIFAHGRVAPGETEGLYKIGTLAEAANSTGFIFFGGLNTFSSTSGYKKFRSGLYVGYTNGSSVAKVKQWDMFGTGAAATSAATNTLLQGDVYTPVMYLSRLSVVQDIMIYMAQGSGSGSTTAGTIKIYFNQSGTAWASKDVTRDEAARGYKLIQVNKPNINAIQIEIEWPTGVGTAGNFDIAPSFAVVTYQPTSTTD